MGNKLAKKALIINIIGAVLGLFALLFQDGNPWMLAGSFFVGEILLIIGLIMGLVSLKNKDRLLSYIDIAIPVIVSAVVAIIIYNALSDVF